MFLMISDLESVFGSRNEEELTDQSAFLSSAGNPLNCQNEAVIIFGDADFSNVFVIKMASQTVWFLLRSSVGLTFHMQSFKK